MNWTSIAVAVCVVLAVIFVLQNLNWIQAHASSTIDRSGHFGSSGVLQKMDAVRRRGVFNVTHLERAWLELAALQVLRTYVGDSVIAVAMRWGKDKSYVYRVRG